MKNKEQRSFLEELLITFWVLYGVVLPIFLIFAYLVRFGSDNIMYYFFGFFNLIFLFIHLEIWRQIKKDDNENQ